MNTNDKHFKGYLEAIEDVPEFAAQTPEMKQLIADAMARARRQGRLEEERKHGVSVPLGKLVMGIVVLIALIFIVSKCTHA
jgi:hypothetical protein